jgi:hypothetical protein
VVLIFGQIVGSNYLLEWECLSLFDRFGYAEMIKCLIIKILLICRLSTSAVLCSVHGHLFNVWRTATYLQRYLHSWMIWWGSSLPNMGGNIISGLVRCHLRGQYNIMMFYVSIFLFTFALKLCVNVYILIMRMPRVIFSEKKIHLDVYVHTS